MRSQYASTKLWLAICGAVLLLDGLLWLFDGTDDSWKWWVATAPVALIAAFTAFLDWADGAALRWDDWRLRRRDRKRYG